jgi:sugar lactone lactonase YvrE
LFIVLATVATVLGLACSTNPTSPNFQSPIQTIVAINPSFTPTFTYTYTPTYTFTQTFTPTSTFTPYQAGTLGSGLNHPNAVAVDSTGNIYVADAGNFAIKKYTPAGVLNTAWGKGKGILTISGPVSIQALAVDSAGILYAAMGGTNGIYKYDSFGNYLTTYSAANALSFTDPLGLAVDGSNNLYISDNGNSRIVELNSTGTFQQGFTASSITGIAVNSAGTTLFGAAGNNTVQVFTNTGSSLLIITGFKQPNGVALDANSDLYVADTNNYQVEEFAAGANLIYPPIVHFTNNGSLTDPVGVAVNNTVGTSASGYIYVANQNTNTVYIFAP